jgi:hypothetical protein
MTDDAFHAERLTDCIAPSDGYIVTIIMVLVLGRGDCPLAGGDHSARGEPGHRTTDNIISKVRQGTSLAYTLDRLRREYPALYERARCCAAAGTALGFP